MSIYNAVFVQSNNQQKIIELFLNWLQSTHTKMKPKIAPGSFPYELYSDEFILDESSPTFLALSNIGPDWTTVHYNSLNKMGDIAQQISSLLSCQAVVIITESVTESYYLDLYQKGENIRTFEYVGEQGEWTINDGSPLEFEEKPLGINISDSDDASFYIFDRDQMEKYCLNLGFSVFHDFSNPEWKIFKLEKKRFRLLPW